MQRYIKSKYFYVEGLLGNICILDRKLFNCYSFLLTFLLLLLMLYFRGLSFSMSMTSLCYSDSRIRFTSKAAPTARSLGYLRGSVGCTVCWSLGAVLGLYVFKLLEALTRALNIKDKQQQQTCISSPWFQQREMTV